MYINQIEIDHSKNGISKDNYIFSIPVVRHLKKLRFVKPVTFFVGENGTGKSTLLEAIAVAYGFNPEGGSKNFNFSSRDSHSGLHGSIRMQKGIPYAKDGFFLRAESFYNMASEVERLAIDGEQESIVDDESFESMADPAFLKSYGGKSLHMQSHGESFISLVENRFRGNGLYILDEPEAALSPTRQMALLVRIHELVRNHSQLVIATHSPILMTYPGADIYVFEENGIQKRPYEQTEHYYITKAFLNKPETLLKELGILERKND